MTFEEALPQLKEYKKIRRKMWIGDNKYCECLRIYKDCPHIIWVVFTDREVEMTYLSLGDIMANDWEVLENG